MYLSICSSLVSSVSYRFLSTGLQHLWLGLFLSILFFLKQLYTGSSSLFVFLIVCRQFIKVQQISVLIVYPPTLLNLLFSQLFDGSFRIFQGFPGGSEVKASACNAGDSGSIPELGRSPGEGNGNPLQYSCLENPMERGAWQATVHGVAKSRTRLSNFTTFTLGFSTYNILSYANSKIYLSFQFEFIFLV